MSAEDVGLLEGIPSVMLRAFWLIDGALNAESSDV